MEVSVTYNPDPDTAGRNAVRSSLWSAGAIVGGSALLGLIIAYVAYASTSFAPVLALLLSPVAIALGVIALPKAKAKLLNLATTLTWWHGLWFLIYVSGMVFRFARDVQVARSEPVDAVAMLRIGPEAIVA